MAHRTKALYSLHDIEEFLRSIDGGGRSVTLYASSQLNRREKEILEKARKKNWVIKNVSGTDFESMVQGQLGSLPEKGLRHLLCIAPATLGEGRQSEGALWKLLKKADGKSLILILDGITDPHNLGAIIRSAHLFGVDAVVLPKRRSATVNETVNRTSAGAVHHTPVISVTNLVRVVERLKEEGYWVYSADLGGSSPASENLRGKTAIVLGSEGRGPSREIGRKADAVLSVPTTGKIDSFNVSVAAGLLMYEVRRQQHFEY